LFSVVALLIAALPAAEEPARQRFDLPAGAAVVMLKRVAQQAGLEIAYSAAAVQGVQTQPVAGDFTPREALERMVAATPLKIFSDPQTGALSVLRTSDSTTQTDLPPPTSLPNMKPRKSLSTFAAWVGLTPLQKSTGGKQKLGATSKMGERTLRRLLIIGAAAAVQQAVRRGAPPTTWLGRMLARKPRISVDPSES
jgi:hypothetical protein